MRLGLSVVRDSTRAKRREVWLSSNEVSIITRREPSEISFTDHVLVIVHVTVVTSLRDHHNTQNRINRDYEPDLLSYEIDAGVRLSYLHLHELALVITCTALY